MSALNWSTLTTTSKFSPGGSQATVGRFLYAFCAQQIAVFGVLIYKMRHGGAGSTDLLADAPDVVKRGLNQRRGPSLATESIRDENYEEANKYWGDAKQQLVNYLLNKEK